MEIEMKSAESTDAAKILKLLEELQAESEFFTVKNLDQLTVEQEADNLDKISETNDNLVLLAMAAGEMIGIVTVAKIDKKSVGEIGIAIRKEYYHKGLGTALLDEIIYWGDHFSPLNKFTLSVIAENEPAIGLYRKMGFKPNKVEMVPDREGIERKSFIMTLELDKSTAK